MILVCGVGVVSLRDGSAVLFVELNVRGLMPHNRVHNECRKHYNGGDAVKHLSELDGIIDSTRARFATIAFPEETRRVHNSAINDRTRNVTFKDILISIDLTNINILPNNPIAKDINPKAIALSCGSTHLNRAQWKALLFASSHPLSSPQCKQHRSDFRSWVNKYEQWKYDYIPHKVIALQRTRTVFGGHVCV